MRTIKSRKFRACCATLHHVENLRVVVRQQDGSLVEQALPRAIMLESYSSIVAAIYPTTGMTYLFPRYDYSATTWQHLRKFWEDVVAPINGAEYPGCDYFRAVENGLLDSTIVEYCEGLYYTDYDCETMRTY